MQANFQFNPTLTANPFFSTPPFGAFSNTPQFFQPPSVQPNFQSAELGQILGSILQALEQLSQGFHRVVGPAQANPAIAQNQAVQVENGAQPTIFNALTQPATSNTPTQTATSSAPTQPATSSAPTQPATSSAPTQPATSSAPTQPATSSAPTQPATSSAPTQPATSSAPTQPATSSAPTQPATSSAPTQPATSSAPSGGDLTSQVNDAFAQLHAIQSTGQLQPGMTASDFADKRKQENQELVQFMQGLPSDVAQHMVAVYYNTMPGDIIGTFLGKIPNDPAQAVQQFIAVAQLPPTGDNAPEHSGSYKTSLPWISQFAAEVGPGSAIPVLDTAMDALVRKSNATAGDKNPIL